MADDGHRDFPGRRLAINLCRAGHVAGLVGLAPTVLAGVPVSLPFVLLLVVSGAAIATIDAWSNPGHFRQVNGLALLAKLAVVVLFVVWEAARLPLFWSLLVYSVLVSHAPASLRHRRIF